MLFGKNVDSETKCPKADSYFGRPTQKETSCEHPQSGIETQHKAPWTVLFTGFSVEHFTIFSRKSQSVLSYVSRLEARRGWSQLLWLVSRDMVCWHPAPPLVLCSTGRLPVWVPAQGISSASRRRPLSRRAAGWTSCSRDPPGGPIREEKLWMCQMILRERLKTIFAQFPYDCKKWRWSNTRWPWRFWVTAR